MDARLRLKAFRLWQTLEKPGLGQAEHPADRLSDAYYYAEPKQKKTIASLDELDPEIRRTYEKLGIPIAEQEVLAGVEVRAGRGRRVCSTASRSRRPSARSWKRRA